MLLDTLVEGFLLDCQARNLSPNTVRRAYAPVLRDLCNCLENPDANSIQTDDLRHFFVDLGQRNRFAWGDHPWMHEIPNSPLSPWTVHRYVRVTKTFFAWATREGLIATNPAACLRYPKLPHKSRFEVFSTDEIRVLLERSREMNYRDYAIVFLLLDTGIRRGELARLTLDDVNVASGLVTVLGKGSKLRTVRVGNVCRKVLWRYVSDFRKPLHDGVTAFYLSRYGTPLTYEAVGSILRRLSDKTGIRVYAHKFRHTFATMLAQRVPNAFFVAQALGHEDISTARLYVHFATNEAVGAARQNGPTALGQLRPFPPATLTSEIVGQSGSPEAEY